jgi:hypothetical protein
MSVKLALGKQRQENCEFKPSMGYIARPHLSQKKNKKHQPNKQKLFDHLGLAEWLKW